MTPSLRFALSLLLLLTVAARAQEPSADEKPAEIFDVKDFARIKENEGQTISVRGKVIEVFTARSGRKLFNFEGIGRRDFNVMIDQANVEAVNGGFDGDVDAAVQDKTIVITGRVSLYRDNPQIEVKTPDQIKVEEGEKTTEDQSK